MLVRIVFLFVLCFTPILSMASGPVMLSGKYTEGSIAGKPQLTFLVGFKGGVNFSVVSPTQRFTVLQPVDAAGSTQTQKVYEAFFRNFGFQYGFIGLCRLNPSISLSLEPTFSEYSMKYFTENNWLSSADPSNRIETRTEFIDRLKYFEIPIVMRYAFNSGKIKPFISAGLFYGLLTAAPAQSTTTLIQYTGVVEIPLERGETAGDGAGNFISSRFAFFPGLGLSYTFEFMTLLLEADYFFGLHNIVDESARYSNQQLIGGTYNVPDNLRFDNLILNLGVLFNINRIKAGSAVECPTPMRKR